MGVSNTHGDGVRVAMADTLRTGVEGGGVESSGDLIVEVELPEERDDGESAMVGEAHSFFGEA